MIDKSRGVGVLRPAGGNSVRQKSLVRSLSHISGSNCFPRHLTSSDLTAASSSGPRYGRFVVIASNVSANMMTRDASGISALQALRITGTIPVLMMMHDRGTNSRSRVIVAIRFAPSTGCSLMMAHSSGERRASLARIGAYLS